MTLNKNGEESPWCLKVQDAKLSKRAANLWLLILAFDICCQICKLLNFYMFKNDTPTKTFHSKVVFDLNLYSSS